MCKLNASHMIVGDKLVCVLLLVCVHLLTLS